MMREIYLRMFLGELFKKTRLMENGQMYPKSSIVNNGTLALRIVMDSNKNESILQKISASGGFSGSAWQKLMRNHYRTIVFGS